MGLTGFMVTSLSARFVFPSVGGEGGAFWLIASSPVSVGRFLFYKYCFYVAPFTLFSLLLVVTSDDMLGIKVPCGGFP